MVALFQCLDNGIINIERCEGTYVLVKVRGDRGRSYGIGYHYVRPKSTTIWPNIDGNLIMVIAHPPMAQFDGIVINVWQNRKVHSDENLWLGKGNGKRGERWYHFMIRYNGRHFKGS